MYSVIERTSIEDRIVASWKSFRDAEAIMGDYIADEYDEYDEDGGRQRRQVVDSYGAIRRGITVVMRSGARRRIFVRPSNSND